MLIVGSGLAIHVTQAQQAGITRADVLRHDLGVPGREVIQVRVDFAPGVAFGRHSHPGAEVAYVLEGTLEYQLDGEPPVTLKAGEANAMRIVKAAAVQLSPVLYSREGTVDKVVRKIQDQSHVSRAHGLGPGRRLWTPRR
jgi:Cupin domain